jgi:hypothetical protein
MGSFDITRVGSPSSSFESRRIEERVIDSNQSLPNSIFDGIQVIRSKLIRDKATIIDGQQDDSGSAFSNPDANILYLSNKHDRKYQGEKFQFELIVRANMISSKMSAGT